MTCCSGKTTTRRVGPHIGEYCNDCGKYIRWIPQEKDWKDFIMPFGKHKGRSLSDIAETDGDYIIWGADNLSGSIQRKFKQAIEKTKKLIQ